MNLTVLKLSGSVHGDWAAVHDAIGFSMPFLPQCQRYCGGR
jgi:hypothetical protein